MQTATTQLYKQHFHSTDLTVLRIPVSELQVGMFISELDRPWTETPFVIQGFVVQSIAEIRKVRKYCEYVHIEERNSLIVAKKPRLRVPISVNPPKIAHKPRRTRTSLTVRLLLFSLLLSVPLQTSAGWHGEAGNPEHSSPDSAQAR